MLQVKTLRSKLITYFTSVFKGLTLTIRYAKCYFITSFIIKLIIKL